MNMLTTHEMINSYAFLQVINSFRKDAGESKVSNKDFLKRVMDELDIGGKETFLTRSKDGYNKVQTVNLDKDEMMLVGMRESKVVRRKVLEYIKTLESKSSPSFQIENPAERARAWADEYEIHIKQIELKNTEIEYKTKESEQKSRAIDHGYK